MMPTKSVGVNSQHYAPESKNSKQPDPIQELAKNALAAEPMKPKGNRKKTAVVIPPAAHQSEKIGLDSNDINKFLETAKASGHTGLTLAASQMNKEPNSRDTYSQLIKDANEKAQETSKNVQAKDYSGLIESLNNYSNIKISFLKESFAIKLNIGDPKLNDECKKILQELDKKINIIDLEINAPLEKEEEFIGLFPNLIYFANNGAEMKTLGEAMSYVMNYSHRLPTLKGLNLSSIGNLNNSSLKSILHLAPKVDKLFIASPKITMIPSSHTKKLCVLACRGCTGLKEQKLEKLKLLICDKVIEGKITSLDPNLKIQAA